CAAHVYMKSKALPDLKKWRGQFESAVGKAYALRGVEITVRGLVEEHNGKLLLRAPGLQDALILSPLEHKLQWNFKKRAPRQNEPEERDAHQHLIAKRRQANDRTLRIEITGPLRSEEGHLLLEVRE